MVEVTVIYTVDCNTYEKNILLDDVKELDLKNIKLCLIDYLLNELKFDTLHLNLITLSIVKRALFNNIHIVKLKIK